MGHHEINIFPVKIPDILGKKQLLIFPPKFSLKVKYSFGNQRQKAFH